MSAFESIKKGLEEALDFSKGHEIILPNIDVAKIRAQTGLSQTDFARIIGVAKGTLLKWEQRRRTPQGPAQVLLALIERKPSIVQELLGDS